MLPLATSLRLPMTPLCLIYISHVEIEPLVNSRFAGQHIPQEEYDTEMWSSKLLLSDSCEEHVVILLGAATELTGLADYNPISTTI